MDRIAGTVEDGLRAGIEDGSIRLDVEIPAGVADIVGAGVGLAYGWIVLPDRFDLAAELDRTRTRISRDYGCA
jgi:hypothetical protein